MFQTDAPSEVENYCNLNDIGFEWLGGGRLRTTQIRPAVLIHPLTGAKTWFNHGAFFNIESLVPDVRTALINEFSIDELPYNTYFGDGGIIDKETIDHLNRAYQLETVRFNWKRGDLLILDNCQVAHGRESFTGEREVLVAMTHTF